MYSGTEISFHWHLNGYLIFWLWWIYVHCTGCRNYTLIWFLYKVCQNAQFFTLNYFAFSDTPPIIWNKMIDEIQGDPWVCVCVYRLPKSSITRTNSRTHYTYFPLFASNIICQKWSWSPRRLTGVEAQGVLRRPQLLVVIRFPPGNNINCIYGFKWYHLHSPHYLTSTYLKCYEHFLIIQWGQNISWCATSHCSSRTEDLCNQPVPS